MVGLFPYSYFFFIFIRSLVELMVDLRIDKVSDSSFRFHSKNSAIFIVVLIFVDFIFILR